MSITQSYQSILDAVEFDELPQAEQETFLLDLNSTIFRGAVARTLERMDEPTRDAWYDLLGRGVSEEAMRRFIEKRVPEAELCLAETIESLADDILAVTTN